MEGENTKQLRLGTALSYLQTAISVIISLIYTPAMLSLLGKNEYGLYSLSAAVIAYVTLLNSGFSGSYVRFYSRAKASGDSDAVAKTNGLFAIVFACIGVLALVAGLVLTSSAELIFDKGLTAAEYATGKAIMLVLTVGTAYELITNIYSVIIIANERFVFHKAVNLLKTVLSPTLTWILLLFGYRSLMMAVVTASLTVAVNTFYLIYCYRRLHVRIDLRHPSLSQLKEISVFSAFIVLIALVDQINWSVDKLLLGRMWGPAYTAVYVVGGTVHHLYMQLSTAISNVFIPRVNRIVAENGSCEALNDSFIRIGRMQTMVLLPVLLGFIFLGQSFIALWTPGGYEESYWAALLLLIASFVPYIQNIGLSIQAAQNKHRFRSYLLAAVAACNFIVSVFLCRAYGVVGCAIGTALAMLVGDGLIMNIYYHKAIGLDIPRFWRSMASFLPTALLLSLLGYFIMHYASPDSWLTLILWGGVFCLAYAVLVFFTALDREEKSAVRALLHRFCKGRSSQ